eukprot:3123235-Heterocapsa_arctica.AAC.1
MPLGRRSARRWSGRKTLSSTRTTRWTAAGIVSPSTRNDACLHVDCRFFYDSALVEKLHDGRH